MGRWWQRKWQRQKSQGRSSCDVWESHGYFDGAGAWGQISEEVRNEEHSIGFHCLLSDYLYVWAPTPQPSLCPQGHPLRSWRSARHPYLFIQREQPDINSVWRILSWARSSITLNPYSQVHKAAEWPRCVHPGSSWIGKNSPSHVCCKHI